jgi:hypothetical protein
MNNLNIKYVNSDLLKVPEWKATHILRPDLLVLSSSLLEFGFIQPIHVRKETMEIIDGSERFLLATNVAAISKVVGDMFPVVEHDCDQLEAMMLHLRLNRGRSSLVAKRVSWVIKRLKMSKRYSEKDFDNLLTMKQDELGLMLMGSLIKSRNIAEHTYSRAWVPIEAPAGTVDNGPSIESPPNPDR